MNVTPEHLRLYMGAQTIDVVRAALLIDLAVEACEEIADPLPVNARGVVLDVASSAYATSPGPGGQQTAGPYTATVGPGGITLSKRQENRLKRLSGRRVGAFSINPLAGSTVPRDALTDYDGPDLDDLDGVGEWT